MNRRLFLALVGVIGSVAFPAAAPFVAGIVGAYMANRAFSDKKDGETAQ